MITFLPIAMLAGALCWALAPTAGAAEESASAPNENAETPSSEAPARSTKTPSKKKSSSVKGKRTREKEAEGTEAPDRFEANTVIKSRYQHNGEPLEVDPD